MAFRILDPGTSRWMKRMTLPRYLSQAGSSSNELDESSLQVYLDMGYLLD